MNFFSHAAVAGRFSEEPLFLLGSMLPDFASMLRVRTPTVTHATLGAGVRFHHLTDDVFHELDTFRSLTRQALSELREQGLATGAARAVAHVGVELLLDASLGQSAAARAAYVAGLEALQPPELDAVLTLSAAEMRRLRDLLETLLRRGVVFDLSSPIIVERLRRTLAHRPRLALGADDPPRVLEWVEATRARVVASTPALLDGLHTELERRLAA